MGKVASNYPKHIIITSDNPLFEDPDLIIQDILKGIEDTSNVTILLKRFEAIKKAISLYTKNSVILILGKGDEEYQIIYDKKLPFNDKKAILSILEQ
jgi:UDP-N-acetylmuramoyl-L-alanyl-D-glutamate--2,6-diaminopimelate ligase